MTKETKTKTSPGLAAMHGVMRAKPQAEAKTTKPEAKPNIGIVKVRESEDQRSLEFLNSDGLFFVSWDVPTEDIDSEYFFADVKAFLAENPPRSPKATIAFCNQLRVPANGNVVPKKYREKYGKSQCCGDALAEVLTGYCSHEVKTQTPKGKAKTVVRVNLDRVVAVAQANGLQAKLERWADLNPGMQRMNLGNVLRGMLKRGERVTVGEKVWKEVQFADGTSANTKTQDRVAKAAS